MATDLLTFPRTTDDVAAIAGDSVRAPTLQTGENYVEMRWGKKKTFRVMTFLGIGTAVDALLEKAPRVKDLTADQLYWFNQVNDAGEIEQISYGLQAEIGLGSNGERVTFRKIIGEDYPEIVPPAKPEKPAKVAAPAAADGAEPAPKAKRGRKAKVVETAAAEATPATDEALVPLDGDVTDATAEAPVDLSTAEQPEVDDRVAA
jgi:hypothetical protein